MAPLGALRGRTPSPTAAEGRKVRFGRTLVALAVVLLATAALLGLLRTECSTVTTDQTVTTLSTPPPVPAAPQPAAPGSPPASRPAGTPLPQPTSQVLDTDGTTKSCSKASVTSVPVLVLLALAALCLSPWVKKLTVGAIAVERADATAPQHVVAGLQPDGGAGEGVGVWRARAAEIFVEGADLPAPWTRAGVVLAQPSMSGPDISFVKKRSSGRATQLDLSDPAVQQALVAACNAAAEDPTEIAVVAADRTVRRPAESTSVTVAAAAGRNAGGRVVALAAAVLPSDAELTEQVAAALVDIADAWARVVIDLLLQNDDEP